MAVRHETSEIVVIGAGVIGLSVALALRERGLAVRVLERDGVGTGASSGNAGGFAFSEIVPLATPGIMRRAPFWLLDPGGPLSVPPRYALRIAPWLWRFRRASRPRRYAAALSAQASLMNLSRAALNRRVAASDLHALLRHDGQIELRQGAASFAGGLPAWHERERRGIPFRHLTSAEEIAELQPGVSPAFTHGTFTPEWPSTDPAAWMSGLASRLRAAGGTIETRAVMALVRTDDGIRVELDGGAIAAVQVVVAAGARSHRLLAPLGLRIPLEAERGYNTTLRGGAFDLRRQITFADHGFVVSRVGDRVRVGGAVELGGVDAPPHPRRARRLLDKACAFLPGLDPAGGTEWMGLRPSLPDSLPAIGRHPRLPGAVMAFGHGHLGLTQSCGTAEIVADLVTGRAPDIDLEAFAPDRFERRP